MAYCRITPVKIAMCSASCKYLKIVSQAVFPGETSILHCIAASKQLLPWPPIFLCLVLLLSHHIASAEGVRAENPPASSSFQAGKKAFQSKEYDQALTLFKQAEAAGLDKPALFYNIGVCSYKLGLYEEATKSFLRAATFPKMAALAYYNLAVVAEKQADLDAALSWLQKSLNSAGPRDDKLVLLAQTALSRIRSRNDLSDHWTRYAALGIGYDDNVAMLDSDDLELISAEEDSFADLFAFMRSPLLGSSVSQGPFLQGSLALRDYTDLNNYDTGSLRLEGRYRQKAGGFQLEGAGGYSYLFWDHSGYSQSPLFSLQAKRFIGGTSFYRLRYEARYLDILNSSYDYLRGWQQRATVEYAARTERYRLILGYSLEENDRHDQESSPRRHLLSAALEFQPLASFSITLAASYRDSFYDQSGRDDRNEDRYETSLQLNYSLSKNWELSGRYLRTINISTSPLYDYTRNMTSISLGYSF